ncbi:prepilin-type N-terminal cleavage/methylation domain-containing protein [Pseudoalteromonas sp. MM17-2]|uniref:type IV pilus modification PilV family protein n=1 Tax=unclassified Pseudoalteromonas TaxID=194690 RepID=UPI0010239541|nr:MULTISPECIES: prepilin-type N-terminal cleavage/methylation domain-containing protein [unclassified Pseudoalteromonas]MCG7543261.1 prepilin-type N-terminal cleavage/methylation domain-containing protein [Pseudoalteromonas sp. MM17-2]RZF87897.1 prepilin-type N-terminal cleavage/methylation domain-containing protein [Pseudoalteromonas sp. CO325X]
MRVKAIQSGFSLLEIMVSVAIAAIALLGLGSAQLKSLQYATSSFNYTMAIVQANNAAERIWPNLCTLKHGGGFNGNFKNTTLAPQIDDYSITFPANFNDDLAIEVQWPDSRLDDGLQSKLRIFAQYPTLSAAECGL